MRPSLLALAALLLAAVPAAAQTVSADHGNVVLSRPGAAPVRLTTSGRDRDPALSPDGRSVAFVRGGEGHQDASELWIIDVEGRGERRLLAERSSDQPQENLAGFDAPGFAPDGREIFFLTAAWATSGAVHAMEPGTGRVRYVCPGNSLEVVPRGEYAGHLVVSQHRYFIPNGSYDWYWLVKPDGQDVGPIGESPESFRESWKEN